MSYDTAAHVVEPRYPGLVEEYVNLGRAYDRAGLQQVRQALKDSMLGYKECYRRAYRCLSAVQAVSEEGRSTLLTPETQQRLIRRADGILSREVPRQRGVQPGQVRQRFLSAVTHKGPITLYDTALAQCEKVYELWDPYGIGAPLLSQLLSGVTAQGYQVVACPDPMFPQRPLHLLVPELSLAFLTTTQEGTLSRRPYRRLRLETMVGQPLLRHSRSRLRFARKVARTLTQEAVASLAQAKAMHDQLEAVYHPYVDFDLVDRTAQKLAQEILG